ncbi:hypothetical protein B0H63DRAFT_507806 [Podospora didyma]|uniref:Uncharacterized protein n=1 Tax=Podospora didyma TaxID=330526 RepID=A0AAE0NZC0_9PEZI|nr:hypothetical protein B0H63DRAFT_507806 [Podospora didyma]
MSQAPSKRKRASSTTSTAAAGGSNSPVINPLSHSPSTLKQFARAGHAPDQPLPSLIHPGFPHRPVRRRRKQPKSSRGGGRNRSRSRSHGSGLNNDGDDEDFDVSEWENDSVDEDDEEENEAKTSVLKYEDKDEDFDTAVGLRRTRSMSRGQPLDDEVTDNNDGDDNSDGDGSNSSKKRISHLHSSGRSRTAQDYYRRVGCLAAAVQRFLSEGDLTGARRAFGLLVRARVHGDRYVDLRHDGFWELGAEVLIREGEEAQAKALLGGGDDNGYGYDNDDDDEKERKRRHVAAAALERLKAYYGTLVQQHQYVKQTPRLLNALDFYPALFGCEMESVHAEHARALNRLETKDFNDDDDDDEDQGDAMDIDVKYDDDDGSVSPLPPREAKLRRHKDALRLATLEQMQDLARRMDTIMEGPPFSKDYELRRLRAMVALFIGDLCMPSAPRSERQNAEGETARESHRKRARRLLRLNKQSGGGDFEEQWLLDLLRGDAAGSDEEDDEEDDEEEDDYEEKEEYSGDGEGGHEGPSMIMYSSLPLR